MTRHIFSREFWRAFWVSIRRAKRDPRDRRAILRFSFLLLASIFYYGRILWVAGMQTDDHGTLVIYAIFAVAILIAVLLIWTSNRIDARKARIESDNAVDKEFRRKLAYDGVALSVLLSRAGSEQMLREKELPPGIEVITRRSHLELLQKLDLWTDLPAEVRNLLLMPDGQWPDVAVDLPRSFETLRCLRWVLRLDSEIEPLSYFPKMDYRSAGELLKKPELLLSTKGMVDIWDIRVQRNQTDTFFSRCYAEAIGRGMLSDVDNETADWAKKTFENARDINIRDVLVDHQTVSELPEDTLRYVISISFQRYKCLQLIMDVLDGKDLWADWTALCFPVKESAILDRE